MILAPERNKDGAPDYRRAFKLGMIGTDVAALQLNLERLTVDGVFGPATRRRVLTFQEVAGLEKDGIAGLVTQGRLIIARSREAEKAHALPHGMLRSIASNESGFCIAAWNEHPSDSGIDVGPFQRSSGKTATPEQDWLRRAYDARWMAEASAKDLRARFDRYSTGEYVTSNRRGWELAVLSHNWPEAAENLAFLGRIYDDPNEDPDAPREWIEEATRGRLHSANEWIAAYIARSTVYCVW